MSKVEQVIQGLLANERFEYEVQKEFNIEVYTSEDYGPCACFNACGSLVTVKLGSLEQAARLFVGFQGIERIIDVD